MLCVLLSAGLLSFPLSIHAAVATPASDTVTRHKISVTADHEIRFRTPTGIDAPTDTIVVSMPDFTFGVLAIGDLDLFWGSVTGFENSTSVAAVAAAGVWGASISGTTITLTAPTDSVVGSIPATSYIGIRIGANAVGGVNRLTNPSSPIIAQITINGTFGDTALIGVPIITDDTVSVTASVVNTSTPPCTGCGGGGGPSGGPTAPVISNIQVINITNTSARVIWDTNNAADSSVSYGTTIAHASGTVSNGSLVTSHIVDLTGLTPNTLYHFIVSSTDANPLTSTSGDGTFTTLGAAPVISAISIVNITDTTALVTWTTDVPATSVVNFGTTIAYGSSASSPGLVTSHAVQLSGLTPSTFYHLFVTSVDASSNAAASTDQTFTTLNDVTPPPNVSGLSATPGDAIVTLNWSNPVVADFAGTKIMRKTGGYPSGPFDGTQVYSGPGSSVVDTGLTNGVTYFYGAYAYDVTGNFASGALANATPNGITPPPPTPTTTPPTPPPVIPPPVPALTPSPTPAPTQQPGVSSISVTAYYYGNSGAVQLTPDANGRIGVLAGTVVLVSVPISNLGSLPTRMEVKIGSSLYSLQKTADGTSFTATFIAPSPGIYTAEVAVTFDNGAVGKTTNTLNVRPGGQVVEDTVLGPSVIGISGATVQLFRDDNGWQKYGSAQLTGDTGGYGFIVPNGRYYAEVSKEGYRNAVSAPFTVRENVFNDQISLIKIPVAKPPPENVTEAAAAVAEQAGYAIQVARAYLQSEDVQAVSTVAAPTLLAMTLANVASSLSLFNLLAYLQYLFTQPLLLFGRRKKRKWGAVFNALTKQPVDLAIVRLVHFETRLVMQTKVTDKQGRFIFAVKKGNYLIEVVKPGYVFPTTYLANQKEDVEFVDLYHGGKLEITADEILAVNIPLDPVSREETPRSVLFRKFTRKLRHGVAFSGVLMGMVIIVVTPTAVSALLLLAQIGVYLLFRRLSLPAKAKSWGITFDAKTRKPLGGVIVRIFDKKFNKLLETQVTDQNGKYGFFVRRNVYYLVAQKSGYTTFTSPDIDLSGKDEAIVDQNLPLKPGS